MKGPMKGHGLLFEGQPFDDTGQMANWRKRVGRGKCSCGTLSPVLPNTNQRKAWHRAHKDEIRGEQQTTHAMRSTGDMQWLCGAPLRGGRGIRIGDEPTCHACLSAKEAS